jgi:hypothetical protein
VQAPPLVPQLDSEAGMQLVPLQQPLGQLVASHTQAPPAQRWPLVHAAPVPQRQAPLAQPSAIVGSHATQAAPPLPHAPAAGERQLAPEQQPLAQVIALQSVQTPALHDPDGQAWQAAPAVPQALGSVPLWQLVPEQQPVGQELPSHTQAPATQCWPLAQRAPLPQAQAPPRHESATTGSQAKQTEPDEPHALADGVTQAEPLQQPLGHTPGLQPLHMPPTQSCPVGHGWQGHFDGSHDASMAKSRLASTAKSRLASTAKSKLASTAKSGGGTKRSATARSATARSSGAGTPSSAPPVPPSIAMGPD